MDVAIHFILHTFQFDCILELEINEDKLIKFASHLFQRSKELGPLGLLQRVWMRSFGWLGLSFQSLWWGWMSRRKMSDSSLLARTNGNWQTMDDLFNHLANRPASSFLLPHESSQKTSQFLYRVHPQYASGVLTTADAICRNEITLLGQTFHYSNEVDWHRDPVTGWNWPLLYRSRMSAYVGSARPVDLILFWELNRHQHLISLGIAYWLKGDQRYVDVFIRQITSWIETNPLQHGMNWYYPLEVSIRLLAWTVAFQFFRQSPEFQQKAGKAFVKSLWQQADFLRWHLQTVRARDDTPNNHMMAELAGLVLVATTFPEFSAATEWRETGLRLLVQQANAQTYPDGVNKEQAMGYHRFVAELLLLIVARSRQGALPHEPVLEHTLECMLDYMLFTMTPVGTAPLWGDSDYGRALGLGQNKDFWDFRPLLSAGAVLFDRSDWKFAAGCFDEEAFWLLGSKSLERWQQIDAHPPAQTSRAFPQAGQYIIRDAWTADTDVAFFRCGPFGLGGEGHCAHAHADLLSFVLWVNGQPLLVDSGTYAYHGSLRDYFRLTSAHNTVMVDGQDQALPQPNFNWQQISDATCIDWSGNHVTGAFNYSGVEFIRKLAHPQPGIWFLEDKFSGNDEHKIDWFFNFAPELDFELLEKDRTLRVFKAGLPFLSVHIPGNGISVQLTDAWYSYYYGVKQCNQRLHAQWQGRLKKNGELFHWQFEFGEAGFESNRGQYAATE